VATDGSGNVYVADAFNIRVQKFDASGAFLAAWGSERAPGEFGTPPSAVATDGSGNVYVADGGNGFDPSAGPGRRIEKFDASGTFLTAWGTDGQPLGVATDGSGNVYVADGRIQKFDANGTFLATLGSEGDAIGVATDGSGNVDVLEQAQHYVNYETGEDETVGHDRVEKFDASGALVATWGSSGHGNGQFWYPSAVATDASGNVYVGDTGNNRIEKFDADGAFLTAWGRSGSRNGPFFGLGFASGVATDPSGNVYVADPNNFQIQKFDSNGNFLTAWGSHGSGDGQFAHPLNQYPFGVATDAVGNVYVADKYNYRIQKFACP